MNRLQTLAFIVCAIDRDVLNIPIIKAIEMFKKDAISIQSNYTDPSDELYYVESVVHMNPIDFFTDYILMYAKMYVLFLYTLF